MHFHRLTIELTLVCLSILTFGLAPLQAGETHKLEDFSELLSSSQNVTVKDEPAGREYRIHYKRIQLMTDEDYEHSFEFYLDFPQFVAGSDDWQLQNINANIQQVGLVESGVLESLAKSLHIMQSDTVILRYTYQPATEDTPGHYGGPGEPFQEVRAAELRGELLSIGHGMCSFSLDLDLSRKNMHAAAFNYSIASILTFDLNTGEIISWTKLFGSQNQNAALEIVKELWNDVPQGRHESRRIENPDRVDHFYLEGDSLIIYKNIESRRGQGRWHSLARTGFLTPFWQDDVDAAFRVSVPLQSLAELFDLQTFPGLQHVLQKDKSDTE